MTHQPHPEDDDDTTRVCTKCGERPRWSKHGCCKRCLECAGKSARWCISVRKTGELNLSTKPSAVLWRQRCRAIREAGGTVAQAMHGAHGRHVFAKVMAELGAKP